MRTFARVVSLAALAGSLAAPLLFIAGRAELGQVQSCLIAFAAVWFVAAPLAQRRGDQG